MTETNLMNPFSLKVWKQLKTAHPEWDCHLRASEAGDLELAIPAPDGSRAGHLVLFTTDEQDLGVRLAPPQMSYPADDVEEMLDVAEGLLADDLFFVRFTRAGQWAGTSLIGADQKLVLNSGESAEIISWSGLHDRVVEA